MLVSHVPVAQYVDREAMLVIAAIHTCTLSVQQSVSSYLISPWTFWRENYRWIFKYIFFNENH